MIHSNYSDRQSPQFRVLTDAHCRELYLAALEVMQRVGIQVNHPEARKVLVQAGATQEGNIVYIPPHIIQEAIAVTPHSFTIWGRDYKHHLLINPDKAHFGPGPTCTYFIDPTTCERRRARRGDAAITAIVCDALVNIDYVMGLSFFDDVKPLLSPVYEFAEAIANTTKPVIAWANNPETAEDIYQIALAVVKDPELLRRKPIFALFGAYESPLRHPEIGLANLLWAVDRDVPVIYLGGPTVGLESPFTGASALVIYLATVLSSLAIVQLRKPGARIVLGGIPAAMDLRTARPSYGSPEMSLYIAAAVDIARYLGIPFMGTAGASESKQIDAQAGIEASIGLLVSAMSGASMVHDLGFLDCGDLGSPAYLVLADEILGMIKRIMRGLKINRDTIMLDLIEQVGPGGSYLGEPRSAAMCRTETWIPSLLDRDSYQVWENNGAPRLEDRIVAKTRKILDTHQPEPLEPGVQSAIARILNVAEQRTRSSEIQ